VRLLGVADSGPHGLFQRVHPHLVPLSHPLAHVVGSTNAVVAEGNFVGRLLFQGAGAGDGPTASAVVADLIDIARGEFGPPYAMPADALAAQDPADSGERRARAYVRFTVADKVGVLAEIAAAMRDAGVSIESLIQRGANPDGSVLVAIVTHEGPERSVAQALEKAARLAEPRRRADVDAHPLGLRRRRAPDLAPVAQPDGNADADRPAANHERSLAARDDALRLAAHDRDELGVGVILGVIGRHQRQLVAIGFAPRADDDFLFIVGDLARHFGGGLRPIFGDGRGNRGCVLDEQQQRQQHPQFLRLATKRG
jgi:hypothetical protein